MTSSLKLASRSTTGLAFNQIRTFAVSVEAPRFKDVDPRVRYPKMYFDFKAWRHRFRKNKQQSYKWEQRAIRHLFHKPAPEGWDPKTFLMKMQISPDEKFIDDFAAQFKSWGHFAGMSSTKIRDMKTLYPIQKRRLIHYLELFNHGLWPEPEKSEYYSAFQGKPYAFEGKEWTNEEDKKLVTSAEHWGVGFGDVWLYVSHDMQRPFEEVRKRYYEIVVKPKQRSSSCELVLSKCMQPLLMNRQFRMLPSTVYLIPSEKYYPVAVTNFKVPKNLLEYRDPDNFAF